MSNLEYRESKIFVWRVAKVVSKQSHSNTIRTICGESYGEREMCLCLRGRVVIVLRLQPRGQQRLQLRRRATPAHAHHRPMTHL